MFILEHLSHVYGLILLLFLSLGKSLFVILLEAHYINVSAVHILQGSPLIINSYTLSPENTANFDSVTWFDWINDVFITANVYGLGSFSLWDTFGGFL